MDVSNSFWDWLPQFTRGDLPSWIAVAIALIAAFVALRKSPVHSELHIARLHIDDAEGPITLDLDLTTYSHAARLKAQASLKLDGVNYPMTMEPLETPQNLAYAAVNTFHLHFKGTFDTSRPTPKTASIDAKTTMSDESRARFKSKQELVPAE